MLHADREACGGCHDAGLQAKHALPETNAVEVKLQHWAANGSPVLSGNVQLPAASVVAATNEVVVRFNVKVDGAPRYDFTTKAQDSLAHNEDAYWYYVADSVTGCPGTPQAAPNDTGPAGCRTKITSANWSLVHNGNGNYTATIAPAAFVTLPLPDGTVFMLSTMNPLGATATAVATLGTATHDVVSDQACINCHGNHVWRGAAHDVTNPQGMGPCMVCHNRKGAGDPKIPGAGSGLMGLIHGIHNSEAMPDGQYTFTWTNGNTFNFSIGFPSFMNNCSVCHDSTARLAAVKDTPVTYATCMSCHDSWDGFPNTVTGGILATIHRGYTNLSPPTACAGCHNGTTAPATIASFHNGLKTERAGLIWDGADQSVVIGKTINMQITGVTAGTNTLVVTWTASLSGTAVNPCNANVLAGPVFIGAAASNTLGTVASNMSLLKAYAQADDWVNAGQSGTVSPGQPTNVSLGTSNTACAGNVATSTIANDPYTTATRGIVALQGKPQVRFAAAAGTTNEVIQVRAKTPTREFVPATGAAPAAVRRAIVDTVKCLACHTGSLYQHGGNRVDNNDLCVMCHNPASSEQQNRVNMGVDATEAYDGKVGQTYDMRTMVHAIHSAGESGALLVYYRSNGIYLFGPSNALTKVPHWPTTGGVSCLSEGSPVTYYPVYGSVANGTSDRVPTVNADGTCNTTTGPLSTGGVYRIHNFIPVEYPRPLNECGACHADSWTPAVADGSRAVGVTVNAGASPWGNQLDDVLMGPSAAACLSCHQSGDPLTQSIVSSHVFDMGWWPSTFTNGRQTLIDAATP
jgi:hypothetical protein